MTKLTEAQTRAVVTYLDEVAYEARKLGEANPLVAQLATLLRAGVDFTDIKLWLTKEGIAQAIRGQTDVTGLCGGLICALNLIEQVVEAKEPEQDSIGRWYTQQDIDDIRRI